MSHFYYKIDHCVRVYDVLDLICVIISPSSIECILPFYYNPKIFIENFIIIIIFSLSAISNQYRVDGLMPKTFYHFRARARNEAGYSDYSNMIYLQTSASHAVGELLGSASTSKSVISLAQPFIVLCSILSTTTILSMVVMPVEVFVGWRSWGRIICAQQL